jgi:hypothetical protein
MRHGRLADHDRFHPGVLRQQRLDPRDLLGGEGHNSIVKIFGQKSRFAAQTAMSNNSNVVNSFVKRQIMPTESADTRADVLRVSDRSAQKKHHTAYSDVATTH